jgi:hypothetical protein
VFFLSCTSARSENLTWLKIGTGLSQKWEKEVQKVQRQKKKKKKIRKWQKNCAPSATLQFKQRKFYDKSGLNSGGSYFLFRQWQSLCYCLTMWHCAKFSRNLIHSRVNPVPKLEEEEEEHQLKWKSWRKK